jgi:hypothetical protein
VVLDRALFNPFETAPSIQISHYTTGSTYLLNIEACQDDTVTHAKLPPSVQQRSPPLDKGHTPGRDYKKVELLAEFSSGRIADYLSEDLTVVRSHLCGKKGGLLWKGSLNWPPL